MSQITFYGAPHSLYSGRVRSYFIKAGLPYFERPANTEDFVKRVLPQAGNRHGLPTIETEEGEVIRDGAAIIDHYEAKSGHTFSPSTPKQRVLSRLFDVIGAEGLLRPAMHYRWNFPEENLDFLTFHFAALVPNTPQRMERAEKLMQQMRQASQAFGAVADTFELVEALYEEFLQMLDAHLAEHPYLLGGKPSIGDFGMIAPLFAHLGRDPKPLALMQKKSPHVFRWVERMNRQDLDVGEFEEKSGDYLPDDAVPEALIALLKHIALDFVPETRAAVNCINDWIAGQKSLPAETIIERAVGVGSFEVRGTTVNAIAQPYRFYLLKRVQDEVKGLPEKDRDAVEAMLEACDMRDLLSMTLSREIGRKNNREVWL